MAGTKAISMWLSTDYPLNIWNNRDSPLTLISATTRDLHHKFLIQIPPTHMGVINVPRYTHFSAVILVFQPKLLFVVVFDREVLPMEAGATTIEIDGNGAKLSDDEAKDVELFKWESVSPPIWPTPPIFRKRGSSALRDLLYKWSSLEPSVQDHKNWMHANSLLSILSTPPYQQIVHQMIGELNVPQCQMMVLTQERCSCLYGVSYGYLHQHSYLFAWRFLQTQSYIKKSLHMLCYAIFGRMT